MARPLFSIVIPLYNRPAEINELLESLTRQSFPNFEVIIVDDGSLQRGDKVCEKYADRLDIKYFYKDNEGPGLTRNYGCLKAQCDFFVFFDSDCLIPQDYFKMLEKRFSKEQFDAFGGPDAADDSFTPVQKAINFSMTSIFTTGGIRGNKKSVEKFHPRSFNMGISRKVFEETKGFMSMRFGEDIDFSIRIIEAGFTSILIPECFVYHKRRTNFRQFYKQVYNSGIARINLYFRHPQSLKLLHFFPAAFTLLLPMAIIYSGAFRSIIPVLPFVIYFFAIFLEATFKNRSIGIGFLSLRASLTQLLGYGLGFIKAYWKRVILRKDEFHAFKKNFYK